MLNKINKSSFLAVSIVSSVLVFAGAMTALAAGPDAVNLSSAGNFTVLAKSGISTTGATSVVGDMGISPAAATFITGFGLGLTTESPFSTSSLVSGKIYAPGYANPTSSIVTTAVADMQTAYTDAAGRTNPTATELGAGNIGGLTIAPGLYKWGTGVSIPTDVTLAGGANDVWIFQIAQTLTVSSGVKIILSGGAQAKNIFWVVAGQTTIGTTAEFNGNILDQTAIALNTGAKLNGRALAQTAVTLDANTVTSPVTVEMIKTVVPVTVDSSTNSTISNGTSVSSSTGNSYSSSTGNSSSTDNSGSTMATGSSSESSSVTADAGCKSGNKFSTVNGRNCTSNASPTMPSSSTFGQQIKAIAVNLTKGKSSADVKTLQQFLASQNKGAAAQALAKVGGTNLFGEMTRAALAEFQKSVGITPAVGNFGAVTRAYISAHY